ncbi:hypothetical protein HZH66_002378 [Vespula vulgaris]|uniref:Mos1 transposase HTH domain-containing protein n=1 Tax=Vespula vulgaris TaxID=7454 RepID=A0A834KJA4_VESVU|nr:hypothetical protein HZH66_002378 [Vespula vulgaris]
MRSYKKEKESVNIQSASAKYQQRYISSIEFYKGSNATVVIKNICDIHPSVLDILKCQRWFFKFRSGNVDLFDSYQSGRLTTLNNDVLKAEMGTNSCQKIENTCQTFLTNHD